MTSFQKSTYPTVEFNDLSTFNFDESSRIWQSVVAMVTPALLRRCHGDLERSFTQEFYGTLLIRLFNEAMNWFRFVVALICDDWTTKETSLQIVRLQREKHERETVLVFYSFNNKGPVIQNRHHSVV